MSTKLALPFIWTTARGEKYSIFDMKTSHIFFSLRMIYNHTVPPEYVIPHCKPHTMVSQWSVDYRRKAVKALLTELSTRTDITNDMTDQLKQMRDNYTKLCNDSKHLEFANIEQK